MLDESMVVTLERHSYRLDAPLAGSAYGLVWRATQLPAGRQLALKFVNQEQMARAAPAQQQRWIDGARQEAALLRQLAPWDGRHIVRLCDSGEHGGLPVLALELLAGDAGAWVARRRAAGAMGDLPRALAWIGQLNQALAKVHQHGWRHLDLKPSNLLLTDDARRIKLTDFGTSRPLADTAPHDYTGTPNWQAPEQVFALPGAASSGAAYRSSAATDYFALGALFYYFVTGGVALRFCSGCALAWREGRLEAAARLRALHGGVLPPTLHEDEAALFEQRCLDALAPAAAAQALLLLRALLAFGPAQRPAHAVAIGRMLARIDDANRKARAPSLTPRSIPSWSLS
jgi:serine/threonine-protein kinase